VIGAAVASLLRFSIAALLDEDKELTEKSTNEYEKNI
jgi:hypothetical protein